ncbi:MAG: hypothetical protein AAB486_01110 [Patescibacteria group bacterium]
MQAQVQRGVPLVVGQPQSTASQRLAAEMPYKSSLRFRTAYPVLSLYYRAMGRFPVLGRFLLAQNRRERDVMKYAATSTALARLYEYPGFLGALKENRGNPWPAFWSFLNENCQNARDVRYRTWMAVDLLVSAIQDGAVNLIDLAAGSALAPWLAMSRTGFSGRWVLIDYAIHSVDNQYRAAAKTGMLGRITIEPALVLDQPTLRNGKLVEIGKRAEKLRWKLNKDLGLSLTLEQFIDLRPVAPGTLYDRIRLGARVVPIVGDAQTLLPFLGDGHGFDFASILGFLDYLDPDETVRDLQQTHLLLRHGGTLAAALMAPNAEISGDTGEKHSFVRNVPWYYAAKMGLHLKPKTDEHFVRMVRESGYEVKRLLRTPSGVYNIIVATV